MKSDRIESRCGRAVAAAWMAMALAAAAPAAAQPGIPFPIQPGQVVVTCSAGDAPDGAVLAVFDIRNPAANAPGLNQNWLAPAYHAPNWTSANFNNGEVFGVTLDDDTPPNIYATASSSYGGGRLGSGKVFRVDGTTGAVTVFADLPNCPAYPACPGSSYAGLGNIAYDEERDQFFVTNFYDGKIYRLSASGAILEAFDFGAAFDPARNSAQGFVPLGERPWGVAVHDDRVYFAIWGRDYREGTANTVWSVGLDAAGAFEDFATQEVTVPTAGTGLSMPVADISFSVEGRMLLAQRTMVNDFNPGARQSQVLEYTGGHLAWTPSTRLFEVGMVPRTNAAGGADYLCEDQQTTGVAAMGDALHFGPGDFIFGLQIFPPGGGRIENSYLIDLDHNTSTPDKFLVGSLDAHDVCGADVPPPTPWPDYDAIVTSGWNEDTRQKIPFGAADDDWQVVSPGPVRPATVVLNPPPVEVWPRASKVAKWISSSASGQSSGPGTTEYRTCFCLSAQSKDAMIMLKLRADDQATMFLNGRQLAGPGGQFRRAEPLEVNINDIVGQGFLQFGENCLTVRVADRGNLTGFSIAGSFWVTDGLCVDE
ncbi:MAG TPA: hypothetical protein VEL74_23145 [Thermoanaerobaculia bacterium]|nr:hypothetical protein [Thermoanaerobaculia bacterium]